MLFPLSEVGSTVGASSLPQGETADEPKGEQDDGQEDAQEGERVLQDPDPADWAASDHNDGIGRVPGDIPTVDVVDPGVVGGYPCDEVGVGRRRGGGDGAVAVRGARELALAGLQVVGGRPLLQQGLVVHGGRRPPRPARLPLGLAPDCGSLGRADARTPGGGTRSSRAAAEAAAAAAAAAGLARCLRSTTS